MVTVMVLVMVLVMVDGAAHHVWACAFVPTLNGLQLVSGRGDGHVRVWVQVERVAPTPAATLSKQQREVATAWTLQGRSNRCISTAALFPTTGP